MPGTTLIVDASLGIPEGLGLVVLERDRRRRRGWEPIDLDSTLERLSGVTAPSVVLASHPVADPGAAAMIDLARVLGVPIVLLPDEHTARAFVVAAGRRWLDEPPSRVATRLWTLSASLTDGRGRDDMFGLGASGIARWARRAAVRCAWCAHGRHVQGAACPRCGSGAS